MAGGDRLRALALATFLLTAAAPPPPAQQSFASPDAAVTALVDAVKAGDAAALGAILGPGSGSLVRSGDPTKDSDERKRFLDAYAAKHALTPDGAQMVLHVGADDWPLPIPLVQQNGQWHFDAQQGAQQIVDRRIGRNELAAIHVCLAYVQAQQDYFDLFKQVTGEGRYAQLLVSTAGNYDGLYWPSADGIPDSPFTALVEKAEEEGYPGDLVSGKRVPYQGYFYRILKAQGPNAPGGAQDYVANGRMTRGFAMIAWPARYAASGIMTFIVSKDGVVFQKNLGPATERLASAMTRFDPDISWTRVDIANQ